MKHQLRDILTVDTNMILINHLWPNLRQRQYYNAMCELKHELEILIALPKIASELKIKIRRSLEKITRIIDRLNLKN